MFPTWILYQGFSSQTSFNAMAVLNACVFSLPHHSFTSFPSTTPPSLSIISSLGHPTLKDCLIRELSSQASAKTSRSGSIFGRASAGYLSDHIGRFNTMLLTLVWTLIVTLALWLPVGQNIVLLYVAAPAFGFGGGCVISLTPVCIGQLCKASQYGRYFGTSYSVVSFA